MDRRRRHGGAADGSGIDHRSASSVLRAVAARTPFRREQGDGRENPRCSRRTAQALCRSRTSRRRQPRRGAALSRTHAQGLQPARQDRTDPCLRLCSPPASLGASLSRWQRARCPSDVLCHAAQGARHARPLVGGARACPAGDGLQEPPCRLRCPPPGRSRRTRHVERGSACLLRGLLPAHLHQSGGVHGKPDAAGPAARPHPDLGRRGNAGGSAASEIRRRAEGGALSGTDRAWGGRNHPRHERPHGAADYVRTARSGRIVLGIDAGAAQAGLSGQVRRALDAGAVSRADCVMLDILSAIRA
ncbi:hypothetical protein KL86PLE_90590 [uncultured Pleomorphomonas sp.]|uniref:Uncharacterized protein n=1 Tax=uncultured Pleomorphomonas sp. TaxID=442121 RepID=A0A212LQ90_9HYPH|nr:hypothetical protein KL86PLE_90590 [uncultured Pleomorphomonas sp.]